MCYVGIYCNQIVLLIKWMNLFHIMKKVLFVSFSLFVLHEIMLKAISLAHKILNVKAFSCLVVLDIEIQILNLEFRISNFRYWISNFEFQISDIESRISNLEWSFWAFEIPKGSFEIRNSTSNTSNQEKAFKLRIVYGQWNVY
jgi:hypothetical protein